MSDTREFETIKVEIDGAVGRLTLNRPERLNAIGATMLGELAEAARWFDTHHDLRVVIVSGAGRAFCWCRSQRFATGAKHCGIAQVVAGPTRRWPTGTARC
jgi:1,4-dihydroxy-2-naphthoyl-CoA synthase